MIASHHRQLVHHGRTGSHVMEHVLLTFRLDREILTVDRLDGVVQSFSLTSNFLYSFVLVEYSFRCHSLLSHLLGILNLSGIEISLLHMVSHLSCILLREVPRGVSSPSDLKGLGPVVTQGLV